LVKASTRAHRWSTTALFATSFAIALTVAGERRAHACGGGFFLEPEHTEVIVTDHRMAISISDTETIIWDQMKYKGAPTEFAFLFPAPATATVETSNDAWFAALDAYTAPTIYSPRIVERGGCAIMGCAASDTLTKGSATSGGSASSESVVGPYLVTRLAPKSADEVTNMLMAAGFFVADDAPKIIGDYITEGQGFLFMRLRPGCGEEAMQPIRIVIPGSHPTLPLRLASLGINTTVNIELFVLGDRRWAPQNYPTTTIDFSQLRTDGGKNNYEVLADAAFASGDGRNFITEFAGSPNRPLVEPSSEAVADNSNAASLRVLSGGPTSPTGGQAVTGSLTDVYQQLCLPSASTSDGGCAPTTTGMPALSDAADPFFDGAAVDASDQAFDAEAPEAGDDGGVDDGGDAAVMFGPNGPNGPNAVPDNVPTMCGTPSDLTRVLEGIPTGQLYLTRLRAHLPQAAVGAADLQLQPSSDGDVSQYHQAIANDGETPPTSNPSGTCRSAPRSKPRADLWAAATALAFIAAAILRRRR
jgi:hypothetical protein